MVASTWLVTPNEDHPRPRIAYTSYIMARCQVLLTITINFIFSDDLEGYKMFMSQLMVLLGVFCWLTSTNPLHEYFMFYILL